MLYYRTLNNSDNSTSGYVLRLVTFKLPPLIRTIKRLLGCLLVLSSYISSAQFNDNFSDGDFTNNPAWTGAANFIINGSSQLQLNNTVASTSLLSTAFVAQSLDNFEWQVYVKQTFAPSATNFGRVYLASDQSNLTGSLNGYYLRFGEAGALDAVELFKQTGLISSSVCRATNGSIANSANLRVRVLRSNTGLWKLMIDYTGGTNFVLEASGTDATFNSSSYLGVVCVYTASNANKFFYDDFFMGPEIVDITPPSIVSVNAISNLQLDVLFNEKVDLTSTQLLVNYSVDRDVGNPVSAILQPDEKTVRLTFGQMFPNALTCQLTTTGIQDLFNNAMSSANQDFFFFQPVPAELRDIIITEIFADPSPTVGLPELEFVEIYNRSEKIFDLQNWKITDGSSIGVLPSHLFFPGEYIILASTLSAAQFSSYGTVLGVANFPTLNNAGDNLVLKDNTDAEIDPVFYTDTWYHDEDKKQGGYSIELIDPTSTCAEENNWKASEATEGGTPGTQNSVFTNYADLVGPKLISVIPNSATELIIQFNEKLQTQLPTTANFTITPTISISHIAFADGSLKTLQLTLHANLEFGITYSITAQNIHDCPGNIIESDASTFVFGLPEQANSLDIVINEILFNPSPTVGLPESEFIEIFNRSNKIVDLKDWKITDGSSTGTLPAHLFFPNQYIILTSTLTATQFSSYGHVLGVSNFPGLNNSGDNLVLKDNTDWEIDVVFYTDSWYRDEDKKHGGYSIELIDPNNICAEENNWKASEAICGGTPGIQNSVFTNNSDLTGPNLISAIPTSATEVTITFNEKLRDQIPATTNFTITPSVVISQITFADASRKTLQLSLETGLQSGVMYSITLQNIYDCPGNVIDEDANTFVFGLPEAATSLDVLINEIHFNPTPTIGLPEFEFIEIFNRSNKIFDLQSWKITDGSSLGLLPSRLFFPSEYIILTSPSAATQFSSYGNVLSVPNFPSLNNSGEVLILLDSTDTEINKIKFTDTWYRDDDKKEGGYSLERIDPDNLCAEETNWIASEATSGGTPGTQNSVYANMPDLTGPKLVSAIPTSAAEIIVRFDEKLSDQLPAITDFTITPPISISQLAFVDGSLKALQLTLSTNLESGITYTITAQNIYDCPGNIVNSEANTFVFGLPEEPDSLDIVINEILFNPRPTGIDFVEVYNNSQKFFNLKNWSIANFENGELVNIQSITVEDFLLPPNQYIVFTENNQVVKGEYVQAVEENLFEVENLPGFSDDAGTVALVDPLQTVIDSLEYSDNDHSVFIDDDEGVSLERISFNASTNDKANWKSANSTAGFATPGFVNSNVHGEPTPGKIVINPEIFEPVNGQPSFTQIQYNFEQGGSVANVKIMDFQGREIKQIANNATLSTEGFFRWDGDTNDGTKARIGYYIVWIEVFNADGSLNTFRKRVVVAPAQK
jgi:hypothetical protein